MGDTVVYRPDLRARAVGFLLQQWQESPKLVALVESLATGAQHLEDQSFGLLVSTTFTAATGVALEQWGQLVGEVRGGLDDEDYRAFIESRILANNSTGTTDQLIEILQLSTAPSIVRHTNLFPACFQMEVLRTEPLSSLRAERVGRLMRLVKPAGICMLITEAAVGSFGFLDNPEALGLDAGLFARVL